MTIINENRVAKLFFEKERIKNEKQNEIRDFDNKEREVKKKLQQLQKYPKYFSLIDRCIELQDAEYSYRICFFDEDAKQSYTSLGRFVRFSEDEKTAHFENGDWCPGGPARSLNVKMVCGAEERILGVKEPARCAYEARMTHPSACAGEGGDEEKPDVPSHYEL